jgi:hypothetical protein
MEKADDRELRDSHASRSGPLSEDLALGFEASEERTGAVDAWEVSTWLLRNELGGDGAGERYELR